jgi:exosortase A-associated hydrolase 1
MITESAVTFDCAGETLCGILHRPPQPGTRGVVIVVGGPQTRVGSHRQFVLLARALAGAGVPVLRFDYRGMGDTIGESRDFTGIENDIRAAIDHLCDSVPVVREVVLWGLCDAASAILCYAHRDPRVTGIALANPWARTEGGAARAYLHDYYLHRLVDANFWRKVLRGEFAVRASIASFGTMLGKAFGRGAKSVTGSTGEPAAAPFPLREQMLDGLRRYRGRVLLLLSGDDLTAWEFKDMVAGSRGWRRLLARPNVSRRDLAEANHTFSRAVWRDQVAQWTLEWMRAW